MQLAQKRGGGGEQRAAAQPPALAAMASAQTRRARRRGVGHDQPVESVLQRRPREAANRLGVEVRRQFDEHRTIEAGGGAAGAQRVDEPGEAVGRLEAAQPRRVRRRHVDRDVIRQRRELVERRDVIVRRVAAVAVGADIDPDDAPAAVAPGEPRRHRRHSRAVEAQPVDQRLVGAQAEQARRRRAGLRPGRDRPHLDEPRPRRQQRVERRGVLVEAGGDPHRIGEVQPPQADAERRIACGRGRRAGAPAQQREPGAVRGLRRQPVQRRQSEPPENAHRARAAPETAVAFPRRTPDTPSGAFGA